MLLERIVVGVDFNVVSIAAARWTARSLAPEAELILVHCIPTVRPSLASPTDLIARAQRKLDGLREELGFDRVRTEVWQGPPADRIAELAERVDADLVVIGPHNRYPHSADDVGSTAELLIERSCVPVLLSAGEVDGPPRRLLLPVQGLEVSAFVFEWARALEARCGAQISIVHVDLTPCRPKAEASLTGEFARWPTDDDAVRSYDGAAYSSPPAIRRLFHEARRSDLASSAVAR